MKVNSKAFALTVFAIYWGIIVLSMATGIWDTAGAQETTVNGLLPPEEIHGTMQVQEILDTYSLPKEILYSTFKVPMDEPTTQKMRDIAHKYGFEVENVREFIKVYLQEMQSNGTTEDACESCQDRTACPDEQ